MSEEAQGTIPRGFVLSDSNKKEWIIGSFIGIDANAENYEAAEYKGEIPKRYPELIKLRPHGDRTLSSEINFFKHHANATEITKWIDLKDVHYEYLGLPYYLGSGQNVTILGVNVDFLVLARYGPKLETVLSVQNNLLPKPTVLKIAYHILGVLEYLHQRGIVHGNIRTCNIRMDQYGERIVYLLPQFNAVDKSDRNAMTFWSKYQHCGVLATTKRGDFESLLYNLIDWSGGILPWKNASPDEIKDMKSKAFEDPDQFLQDAFPSCECEDSSECLVSRKCVASGEPVAASECLQAIRNFMEQVAFMDKTNDCIPNYKAIEKILKHRLLNMYHVPTSKLEFSVPTFIGDEDHDEKSSRAKRKSFDTFIPELRIAVDTLALIIAENCKSYDEVDKLDNKYYGVIDVIGQMKKTNRILYAAKPDLIREAWEWDKQKLRTKVREQWRLKGIEPGSYKAWKKAKDSSNEAKRTTTDAFMGDKKKSATRHRSEPIASKNTAVVATQSRHLLGLKRQRDQQRKRCTESSDSSVDSSRSSKSNSRPIKRFKSVHSGARSSAPSSESDDDDKENDPPASASESDEDDKEDDASVPASESDEDDKEDDAPASASESDENDREDDPSASASESDEDNREDACPRLNDAPTPTSSVSSNSRAIDYDISVHNLSPSLKFEPHSEMKRRQVSKKLTSQLTAAADESEELFSEETVLETTQETDGTGSQAIERRRSLSVDHEPLSDTYEWMNAWLGFREQSLMVFGSISSEPEEKTRQAFQVRVLRDEFSLPLQRLRCLMNVFAELPSEEVQKLNRIQQRWLNQLVFLDKSSRQLGDPNLSPVHDVLHDQDIVVWLIEELENMSQKLFISTDREALRQQREHCQTVYQRIINKEAEMKMLLNEGRSALRRSQNYKNETVQQLFFDVTESQWNCLKKWIFKNHERLETCVEYSEKYYQAQNLLSRWLTEVKDKLECLKPSSLKEIEKILQELSSLSNMVHEKSGDIEQYTNLGHIFINACDIDKDEVLKNELIAMKDKWDKLNNRLHERRQSLKDMGKRFDNIRERLLEIKDKIQQCQQELASYCASGGAAKDLKIHHHIMEIHNKIATTREQVTDLLYNANKQGIDASYLRDEVNHVTASIENLKTKLLDTCKKILESQFRNIVECDNIIRLQDQISKLKVVLSSVESVLGSVKDAAKIIVA